MTEQEQEAKAEELAAEMMVWVEKINSAGPSDYSMPGLDEMFAKVLNSGLLPATNSESMTRILRELEWAKISIFIGLVSMLASNCNDDIMDSSHQTFKVSQSLAAFSAELAKVGRGEG